MPSLPSLESPPKRLPPGKDGQQGLRQSVSLPALPAAVQLPSPTMVRQSRFSLSPSKESEQPRLFGWRGPSDTEAEQSLFEIRGPSDALKISYITRRGIRLVLLRCFFLWRTGAKGGLLRPRLTGGRQHPEYSNIAPSPLSPRVGRPITSPRPRAAAKQVNQPVDLENSPRLRAIQAMMEAPEQWGEEKGEEEEDDEESEEEERAPIARRKSLPLDAPKGSRKVERRQTMVLPVRDRSKLARDAREML
jgi:hypothetical protein